MAAETVKVKVTKSILPEVLMRVRPQLNHWTSDSGESGATVVQATPNLSGHLDMLVFKCM